MQLCSQAETKQNTHVQTRFHSFSHSLALHLMCVVECARLIVSVFFPQNMYIIFYYIIARPNKQWEDIMLGSEKLSWTF